MRRVCSQCGGTAMAGSERCDNCAGSGYRGRLAVHELLVMNDELRTLTAQRADAVALRNAAIDAGFLSMKHDAEAKLAQGLTDQAELYRVLH